MQNEYHRTCDKRTIVSSLESLLSLGYPINFKALKGKNKLQKTDWYISPIITDTENKDLLLSIAASCFIDKNEAGSIICALSPFIKCYGEFYIISKTENDNACKLSIFKSLNSINLAISENKMISFSVIDYYKNGIPHLHESDGRIQIYLVKPIEVISAYSSLLLFCELGDTGICRYFKIDRLYDVTVTTTKSLGSIVSTAPIPRNKLEASAAFISKRENATLRVSTDRLSEICEALGDEWNIVCRYGNKTEISVSADLRLLKKFILSFGAEIEVLSPTKLRRAVGTELREAASKYSEVRKLYGQL
jgi:hypothetical protein